MEAALKFYLSRNPFLKLCNFSLTLYRWKTVKRWLVCYEPITISWVVQASYFYKNWFRVRMVVAGCSNAGAECRCAPLPRPKNISKEELSVLNSCLSRWKQEVSTTIAQHESDIKRVKHEISEAYEQKHLKRVGARCQ